MTEPQAIQNPGRRLAVHRHELNTGMFLKEARQIIRDDGFGLDRCIEASCALRRLTHIPQGDPVLEQLLATNRVRQTGLEFE